MSVMDMDKEVLFAKLARSSSNPKYFAGYIGTRITKLTEEVCEGELTVTPEVLNHHGAVHGGCLFTLADMVGSTLSLTTGMAAVTLNCTLHFHSPARGPVIRCVATPVKVGKTVSTIHCNIYDGEKLCASGDFACYMTGPLKTRKEKEAEAAAKAAAEAAKQS